MQDRYCLPVIKPSQAEVLETVEKHAARYGFFEVWVDYIDDFEVDFASKLVDKYPGRIVFVFRQRNLEPIKMPAKQRLEVLDTLSGKDCLVDLDITCQKQDLEQAKDKGLKTIVSYHNYENTPPDEELSAIIAQIKSYSPYIVKLSTFCKGSSDALRLVKLNADLLQDNQKCIVLGMGEAGKITRVFGALWANELIFIPSTLDESSAPGQLTREEFDKIMERINQ